MATSVDGLASQMIDITITGANGTAIIGSAVGSGSMMTPSTAPADLEERLPGAGVGQVPCRAHGDLCLMNL